MTFRFLAPVALIMSIPAFSSAQGKETCSVINLKDIRNSVDLLAHPALAGRGTGQDGSDVAGLFLARALRDAGFSPLPGSTDGYFDTFTILQDQVAESGNAVEVRTRGKAGGLELVFEDEFIPMLFGYGTGAVEGSLAFVGYGISAPEFDYDDYADIDVSGRVVLFIRHEPREMNAPDDFFNGTAMTEHAAFVTKIKNAQERGAVGILMVEDVLNHQERTAPIDLRSSRGGRLASAGDAVEGATIPVVSVSVEVADKILGRSIENIQMEIENRSEPLSFLVGGDLFVRMASETSLRSLESRNVLGYLPGSVDEWVLLGAHYDHLGKQDDGVYLGADDNASGTAGVLAAARALGMRYLSGLGYRRNIVIGFWGAEEWGLLGSTSFAQSDVIPVNERIAYVNMDMIGRNTPNEVLVVGAQTNADFPQVSESLWDTLQLVNGNMAWPLDIKLDEDGFFMRTDSGAFFQASPEDDRLPVLALSSGLHDDYHKVTDSADKVNAQKVKQISCLAYGVVYSLSQSEERPRYEPLPEEPEQ